MTDSDEARPTSHPSRTVTGFLDLLLRAALPIGLLAIGGVAYSILSVKLEKETAPPAEKQAIRTKVVELRIEDYPIVIKTNGIVQAHNEVTISAEVSGQIKRIDASFEAGSYFAAGDVLVELDSRDYETALAIAEAQHLGAQSALKLAEQNLARKLSLHNRKVVSVSKAEINEATATRDQAASQVDSAAAQVAQAKRDLQRTKIVAPFDGRVRMKSVGEGQSVGPGTPLGIVFGTDFAEVRLPIAGSELQYLDLPELAADTPVDVSLTDAVNKASETVWEAKIIRTEGALDENSLELFAIARIDDPFGRSSGDPPLRIGQPVVGSIDGKKLNDVIALPRNAVRQLDQIFLVDNEALTLTNKTINPLWSTEEHVVIRDPTIQEGQLLSTTNIVYAPDGAKVEIIPDIELTATTVNTSTSKNEPVAN